MSTPHAQGSTQRTPRAIRQATPTLAYSVQPPTVRGSSGPVQAAADTSRTHAHNERKRARRSRETESKQALPSRTAPRAEPRHKQAVVAERDNLAQQIQVLQARLEQLRLQAGIPTQAQTLELVEDCERNAVMDEMVQTNRKLVSELQAQLSQQLQQPPVNPLTTHIHLPSDKTQRCHILQAMKGVKLRRAAEDGIARFLDLEDSLSYLREERFTTDDCTYHCNRFEVAVYPQFKTARQLYDAVVFWVHNLEISVTEMIDHVALREDEDDLGPTIWNQRLITVSQDVGCTEELNMVGFAQFFKSYDLMDGGPLGIIAQDSVDVDDLHPYKPLERTRKDVQMYYLLSEYEDPVTKNKSAVLKMALFNGQLAPKFPVEPRVIAKLHEYMSRWCDLTNQYLTNFVVPP